MQIQITDFFIKWKHRNVKQVLLDWIPVGGVEANGEGEEG
jgi:hypothetical protein